MWKAKEDHKTTEQYYITVGSRREWKRLFRYLMENGYDNVHSLTVWRRPTRPPVVVVAEQRHWFGLTKVTCLAASASCEKRVIGCETYFSAVILRKRREGVPDIEQQPIDGIQKKQ